MVYQALIGDFCRIRRKWPEMARTERIEPIPSPPGRLWPIPRPSEKIGFLTQIRQDLTRICQSRVSPSIDFEHVKSEK